MFVQDQLVVSDGNQFVGDVFYQFFFYIEWGGVGIIYQFDVVIYVEDVSVYCYGSFVEYDGLNDIGCFVFYIG